MLDDHEDDRELIDGLRRGEPEAVERFVRRYGRSLEAVADGGIATRMGRRFGGDDVAQSVCRTFLRRVAEGQFELDDAESLWRLLCAITLTKVREKARFHRRQKRRIDDEADLRSGEAIPRPLADPTPSAHVEFAETFEHLVADLDHEERVIVDMKLQQRSNEEIAETLDCSERTVRRLLGRLQERFEQILDAG